MGPSGSGKTTLLDVLAGRKTEGVAEGTVLYSGYKPTRSFLRRYTGYVEQFGEHTPGNLTERSTCTVGAAFSPRYMALARCDFLPACMKSGCDACCGCPSQGIRALRVPRTPLAWIMHQPLVLCKLQMLSNTS